MTPVVLPVALRALGRLLEDRTGQVLTESRLWRLETALYPVLRAHGLPTPEALAAVVAADPHGTLAVAATDALLNNETSFFRDEGVFRMIGETLLPHLAARVRQRGDRVLRVWSLGCSTGQEPYSLAMAYCEAGLPQTGVRLRVLATDVSHHAVTRAESGLFGRAAVGRGLNAGRLDRWFVPAGDGWRVDPALRAMIDFRVANAFAPAPVTGSFDLLLCRNLLLYFPEARRRRLYALLARHAAPGAVLLLGAGEALVGRSAAFVASKSFRGAYERAPGGDGCDFPA